MQAIERTYVTEDEFLAWPETKDKVELVDGEVVVSPSVTWRHQEVLHRLVELLDAWARAHPPHRAAFAPLDIRFGRDRILQPDAVVFDRVMPLDTPMPIRLVPALCVEVLSSDVVYDRQVKRLLYAEAGVPEYWVIDPHGGAEVFSGPGLRTRVAVVDALTSVTLPDLVVDVAALTR